MSGGENMDVAAPTVPGTMLSSDGTSVTADGSRTRAGSMAGEAGVVTTVTSGVFVTQRGRVPTQAAASGMVPPGTSSSVGQGSSKTGQSQSTLLLQKKKEMVEVQAQLDRKREEIRERMQMCEEKDKQLAKKKEQIEQQVIKFDKFLKDNDAKRMKANRKAMDEMRQRETKEGEIEALTLELAELKEKKGKIQRATDRNMVYDRYLEAVAENSEEYPEVNDLLMRHATLMAANADLLADVRLYQEEVERVRGELNAYKKLKQNEILVSNSTISQLQQQLEAIKAETEKKEERLVEQQNVEKEHVRLLGQTKMSIANLYSRCRVRHANEGANVFEKLAAVSVRMQDLQEIAASAKTLMMDKQGAPPSRMVS